MVDRPSPLGPHRGDGRGHDGDHGDELIEAMTRTMAHLAAQLTLSQIRLRALAGVLEERGLVAPEAVAGRVRAIAAAEAGGYLRENLGEALIEVIDVEALERDLVAYLAAE